MIKHVLRALIFALLLCGLSAAQHWALTLDGKPIDPFSESGGKLVVLLFLRTDCPISNRYAPTIQYLGARFTAKARFWLVYSDRSESDSAVEKHLRDYDYKFPALRDPAHVLVKRARAQFTPEAAVFDAKGALVYHGRIDNLYVSFGRARPAPTTHELEDAIQAALAGRSVTKTEVAGVGCYISDLE
jgi:hypothetical protein